MIQLGQHSALTLDRLREGILITGTTGSGKTSGPLYTLARLFFAWEFGALILTVKPYKDQRFWKGVAEAAGRGDDLIIVDDKSEFYFNLFAYEANRKGGGDPMNITQLLKQLTQGARQQVAAPSGGNHKFYDEQLETLIQNTVNLLQLAGEPVDVDRMFELVNSAPGRYDIVHDVPTDETEQERKARKPTSLEKWQYRSYCAHCLRLADHNVAAAEQDQANGTESSFSEMQCQDFYAVSDFWMKEFPKYDEKTKGNILADLVGMLRPLRTGFPRNILNNSRKATNLTPDDILDGKIVLLDFPTEQYDHVGQYIQFVFNLMTQRAILRRDPAKSHRPVALIADEFHAHFTQFDYKTQATIRERNGIRLVACQNLPMFYAQLGRDSTDMVDAFLGNMAVKMFARNVCHRTNNWASEQFAKDYEDKLTTTLNTNLYTSPITNFDLSQPNEGSYSEGFAPELKEKLLPIAFQKLADGGDPNGKIVETVIHNKGDEFTETRSNYLVTRWLQDYGIT